MDTMNIKHKFEFIDGVTTLRATINEVRLAMEKNLLTNERIESMKDNLFVISDQIAKLERIINEDDQLRDWSKDWEQGLSS